MACSSVLFAASGCGDAQRPLGEVSGTVTYQGRPVAEAVILFQNAKQGVYMTAATDIDGNYRVVMAEGAGLPLGAYQVAVRPPPEKFEIGKPSLPSKQRPDIPERYRNVDTSKLSLTVESGENRLDVLLAP